MLAAKVVGLLLVVIALCHGKSHLHKHHHKNKVGQGDAKSGIARRPGMLARGTKKQSLGMPFNNLDQQGLGGEPVGHIHDATEGVGGLGGDADGVPVGMGAGAEPLGMAKGNGGAMQGLHEDGEGIHGGNEDPTRPFNEAETGEMEGAHGGPMMDGVKGGAGMGMSMMPSGGGGGGMGEGMMNGGGGGGGGAEGNFMEAPQEGEGGFRGPKKDPLGGDIQPFNDEYKNDDGKGLLSNHGAGSMSGRGGAGGDDGGMNKFSPMQEEGGEAGGSPGGEEMELNHGKGSNGVEGNMGHKLIHAKNTVARHKGLLHKGSR